jgi:hypothetical protein
MRRLQIEGECNRCGACCREMCRMPFMLNKSGVCLFLEDDGLCAVRAKRIVPTDEQLRYYLTNCVPFPWLMEKQDAERVLEALERHGWPGENCGFQVRVDNG